MTATPQTTAANDDEEAAPTEEATCDSCNNTGRIVLDPFSDVVECPDCLGGGE